MANYKLTLCYDGSRYKGWQKQGNTENTIQGKLEALLTRLLGQSIELNGSGRTDAGVHARMQVCSFRAETKLSCKELLEEIRRYLPEDIGAISLEEAEPRFHARLSAKEKTYLYRIWLSESPNVFERKFTARFDREIDVEKMRQAAELLIGEHDFTSFCSNKHMKKSAVRKLYEIDIRQEGQELIISLRGNGFLYNMVRIIVGTLLEVGFGDMEAATMPEILKAKDRSRAGFTAPAQGLFLWELKY